MFAKVCLRSTSCLFSGRRALCCTALRFQPRAASRSRKVPEGELSTPTPTLKTDVSDTRTDYEYIKDQVRAAKSQRGGQVQIPVYVELDESIPRAVTDTDYQGHKASLEKTSRQSGTAKKSLQNANEDSARKVDKNRKINKKAEGKEQRIAKQQQKADVILKNLPTHRGIDQSVAENRLSESTGLTAEDKRASRSDPEFDDELLPVNVNGDNENAIVNRSDSTPISVADIPRILSELESELRAFEISRIRPKLQPRGNLAAYVNESQTLQSLVKLGVRLHEVEYIPGAADLLIKLNYALDVKPVIELLRERLAVESNADIAEIITRFPNIFRIPFRNIDALVTYLESKRFTPAHIARLAVREPSLLGLSVPDMDAKLGAFQMEFGLIGDQIRDIFNDKPKLLLRSFKLIRDMHVTVAKYLGFRKEEVTKIVVNAPSVLLVDRDLVLRNFDYLHNTMMLDHDHILSWPKVLHVDSETLRNRHLFLAHLGKAQYDPKAPCFVSLPALLDCADQQFCQKVAETDLQTYRNFLRTL